MPLFKKIIRGLPKQLVSEWNPTCIGPQYSGPVDKIYTEISLSHPNQEIIYPLSKKKPKSEHELLAWEVSIEQRHSQLKEIEDEIRKSAIEQGFEQGYSEGSVLIKSEIETLKNLANHLSQEFNSIKSKLADEIIELSMNIAKKILMQEINQNPESIRTTLLRLIEEIPLSSEKIIISASQSTLSILQKHPIKHTLYKNIQWQEQENQTHGGFLIRFDNGEIDATLSTRWKRIAEQLGQEESNWES